MFANTITLKIGTADKILVRVNQDNFGSTYKYTSDTEIIQLQFRNSQEKGNSAVVERHNMFVEHTVLATATLAEKYYSYSATLRHRKGSAPLDLDKLATGAAAVLAANQLGLIQGES